MPPVPPTASGTLRFAHPRRGNVRHQRRPLSNSAALTKRFPGVLALDDASLTVRRGEIHAVIGQNGAGKSTMINVLSGMLRPDAGEIVLAGKPAAIATTAASDRARRRHRLPGAEPAPQPDGCAEHRARTRAAPAWLARHRRDARSARRRRCDRLGLDLAAGDHGRLPFARRAPAGRDRQGARRTTRACSSSTSRRRRWRSARRERLFAILRRTPRRGHGDPLRLASLSRDPRPLRPRHRAPQRPRGRDDRPRRAHRGASSPRRWSAGEPSSIERRTPGALGAVLLACERLAWRDRVRGAGFAVRAGEIVGADRAPRRRPERDRADARRRPRARRAARSASRGEAVGVSQSRRCGSRRHLPAHRGAQERGHPRQSRRSSENIATAVARSAAGAAASSSTCRGRAGGRRRRGRAASASWRARSRCRSGPSPAAISRRRCSPAGISPTRRSSS